MVFFVVVVVLLFCLYVLNHSLVFEIVDIVCDGITREMLDTETEVAMQGNDIRLPAFRRGNETNRQVLQWMLLTTDYLRRHLSDILWRR